MTEELCGLEVTSTQVSRAVQALDAELTQWRKRELGDIPYEFLDACYDLNVSGRGGIGRRNSLRGGRSQGRGGLPHCTGAKLRLFSL